MAVQPVDYEALLAQCSHYKGAIALLKRYRPYLETLPSMRRPQESIVTIPLPNIRIRQQASATLGPVNRTRKVVALPCDLALLMCDPEWKIKTGIEIFIFIHRPDEDFSEILSRWRRAQQLLNDGYEWVMPRQHQYLLSEGTDAPYPLFVAFAQTPERIIRGLKGAGLPVIVMASEVVARDSNGEDPAAYEIAKHHLSGNEVSLEDGDEQALDELMNDLGMETLDLNPSDEYPDKRPKNRPDGRE
ncbi:MAG: hypothetical protein AAF152_04830 [Cyanobacteria bacterium P01_A01_bin.114]